MVQEVRACTMVLTFNVLPINHSGWKIMEECREACRGVFETHGLPKTAGTVNMDMRSVVLEEIRE